jgi:DNA-directed RNA polymerase specialized sigma24 family protein
VAIAKMEGYTNAEIGKELGGALSTVERSLRLIRKHWEGEA